jgi:hypothetical protein
VNRTMLSVARVILLCLAVGTPATADPVTITSGSFGFLGPFGHDSWLEIFGTRGFSLGGWIATSEGGFWAGHPYCSPCPPGTPLNLNVRLFGYALHGYQATLDGVTYPFNNSDEGNEAYLHIAAPTVVMPPMTDTSLVIRAPFTLEPEWSYFKYVVDPEHYAHVDLQGRGTATLRFGVEFGSGSRPPPPSWQLSELRYDFATTPEPSTLVLAGGGLAAALLRGRRRRPSRRTLPGAP